MDYLKFVLFVCLNGVLCIKILILFSWSDDQLGKVSKSDCLDSLV